MAAESGVRNVLLRVATAAVLLPPVCAVIYIGGPGAAALIALAGAIAVAEVYRMAAVPMSPDGALGIIVTAALPLLPTLSGPDAATWAFWMLVGLSMALWVLQLARGAIREAPGRVGHVLAGALFVGGGVLALATLRARPEGRELVLSLIAATFANDAGAFAVGKLIGRHRLAPRVSPGKTWEGLAGGALGSTLGALLVGRYALAFGGVDLVVLAAVTVVVGPIGDLSKSLLKRAYGVKDSGQLLPGHGGMLDRIDALLANSVAMLAFIAAHG